jgi:hypothetical protein
MIGALLTVMFLVALALVALLALGNYDRRVQPRRDPLPGDVEWWQQLTADVRADRASTPSWWRARQTTADDTDGEAS